MVLVKTLAGREALKSRHGHLSSRLRSAFILFDGQRTTGEILAATAPVGITQNDIQAMVAQGLLAPLSGPPQAPDAVAAPSAGELESVTTLMDETDRSPQERYQTAYPIAAELTSGLGLRGFRLNLAVEGTGGYNDLVALAPRIRDAVGDAKFRRLEKALFG
ncbi:hypothetical protein D8B23_15860 [Verminephrobacter aporrectodeae subsp. tuberculatae]|uniref:hypothetical protein n=1 Tax=Verminephrobacter aporrectodeae TaxID=1110389 RepID=UPI002243DC0C|nr:hypothetical protein [Verminephrobacter aporrectodeae]MCW8199844.1 hypothetical protein [Verminephrobacter aporrectodeae subsp. tuberculatae]